MAIPRLIQHLAFEAGRGVAGLVATTFRRAAHGELDYVVTSMLGQFVFLCFMQPPLATSRGFHQAGTKRVYGLHHEGLLVPRLVRSCR